MESSNEQHRLSRIREIRNNVIVPSSTGTARSHECTRVQSVKMERSGPFVVSHARSGLSMRVPSSLVFKTSPKGGGSRRKNARPASMPPVTPRYLCRADLNMSAQYESVQYDIAVTRSTTNQRLAQEVIASPLYSDSSNQLMALQQLVSEAVRTHRRIRPSCAVRRCDVVSCRTAVCCPCLHEPLTELREAFRTRGFNEARREFHRLSLFHPTAPGSGASTPPDDTDLIAVDESTSLSMAGVPQTEATSSAAVSSSLVNVLSSPNPLRGRVDSRQSTETGDEGSFGCVSSAPSAARRGTAGTSPSVSNTSWSAVSNGSELANRLDTSLLCHAPPNNESLPVRSAGKPLS